MSTIQSTPVARPVEQGLYHPASEHDACGVGLVAHIKGKRSHALIRQALQILENLDHRGAVGADPLMGDGAGILLQIPDALYREDLGSQGVTLPPPGDYGVIMVFLPKERGSRVACEQALERATRREGQVVLGWRDVPIDRDMPMSEAVRACEPVIRQLFVGRGADVMVQDALERKLYVIRKTASHAIHKMRLAHGQEYFTPSASTRTVVYKGLLLANQVGVYYRDLSDPRAETALALVHQRFSTNTFPAWPLAHPYRFVAHNGEINTVKGNFNWLRAREGAMRSAVLGDDLAKLYPVVYEGQSDTSTFDNCLELLVMAGYPLPQAMMMMIPEAWEQQPDMAPDLRAFYEYHAAMMEPWDGPAAMVCTDGRQVAAMLDRNGLRPARYVVTDDDVVILASEAGTLAVPERRIVRKWRLQPGHMLLVDLEQGCIVEDAALKSRLAAARPYRQWVERLRLKIDALPASRPEASTSTPLLSRQKAFGWKKEDIELVISSMADNGEEAVGSMGNDSPLAVLSNHARPFYHYFRQLFAQVTNPPIDPIREQMVMSLVSFIGPKPNLLDVNYVNPPLRLESSQPVLDLESMARIRQIGVLTQGKFRCVELDITYPVSWGKDGIEACVAALCAQAADAVRGGDNIVLLTDRAVSADRVAIPALLATSAVHQHLVAQGLRTATGLVVETGSAREVHDIALLGGYGAEAVCPMLVMETLVARYGQGRDDEASRAAVAKATANYIKAIGKGLSKVMSKMGISTYMSYTGAQIFEVVGLHSKLVRQYFPGTVSQVEGIGIFEVAEEALRLHNEAFVEVPGLLPRLEAGGEYAFRIKGEAHLWTPTTIANLQHAVRGNRSEDYLAYAREINDQSERLATLRGLLDFRFDAVTPVPLEEVEPAAMIVRRFATGAMSLGSISTEAHAVLAVAMNRIGGKSNTGEGGEDPLRYREELRTGATPIREGETLASRLGESRVLVDVPLRTGDSLRSRIKQVASGRFGVSAEYLVSADQIQIKMAQGAKPGEGGQLPGHKVTEYIAELRYSVPGVGLISPPPHHDIYSIEDLAQLIHDLKNVNPTASISVKLVSISGVGTVAAGVAKAKADHIVIAGHDGGTGAASLSSIKHVGSPWELGLAETQQTLVLNQLRGRIRLQADGQMKTGRDVMVAALLGADEFGFATAPLVAEGCIMMRKCHLNTCPVGVATQDPVLRARFKGQPEHVVNFFFFVAEEVRELMARLGVRHFDELVGRADLLAPRHNVAQWKAQGLDLARVLHLPAVDESVARRQVDEQDHGLDGALDRDLIARSEPALARRERVSFVVPVRNRHRSVGAMLAGAVARRYGNTELADDTIHIQLNGTAGQSFGAFLAGGITFDLVGEGNDYVGKGLSGGRIIVRHPGDFAGRDGAHIIAGNTVLYGALGGEAYFQGVAGERFAVRNSGAATVVEGVGDHGCEYMTGGTVVVLGATGRNFAAGMSGGVAYVWDPEGVFPGRCNAGTVVLEPVLPAAQQLQQNAGALHASWRGAAQDTDEAILRGLIENHHRHTGSARARALLDDWSRVRQQFVKVMPHEYRRALAQLAPSEQPEGKAA